MRCQKGQFFKYLNGNIIILLPSYQHQGYGRIGKGVGMISPVFHPIQKSHNSLIFVLDSYLLTAPYLSFHGDQIGISKGFGNIHIDNLSLSSAQNKADLTVTIYLLLTTISKTGGVKKNISCQPLRVT